MPVPFRAEPSRLPRKGATRFVVLEVLFVRFCHGRGAKATGIGEVCLPTGIARSSRDDR